MPEENYYSSYSFKLISIDVLLSTLTVFGILLIIPPITDFESLRPFREAVGDFNITDVYFSSDIRGELPPETDITIIQMAVPTREGLTEVSAKNYLKTINILRAYEPKTIGVDYQFEISEEDPLYNAAVGILSETPNIVLSKSFDQIGGKLKDTSNTNNFTDIISFGFDNILIGNDEAMRSVREFSLWQDIEGDSVYHYGIELAKRYNPDAVDRILSRGNQVERINFRGNIDKFKIINVRNIIKGNFEEADIRNKIIMLGYVGSNYVSANVEDLYFTPLNENTAGRTFPDMYKLIVDANIVSMLLTDEYFDVLSTWITVTFAFVLCYINMILFGYIGYRYSNFYEVGALILFMIETFGIGYLTVYLFENYRLESNFTLAIVAVAISIPIFELYTDTFKPFVKYVTKRKSF
ncbi:CHASE2 domain-containing protein [Candidatus Kapabacteria bacterium]|nr:CHASE2 domain-containing protein [Candidatus Kapabacteria bacterium]